MRSSSLPLALLLAITGSACGLSYQQRQDRFRERYTAGCRVIHTPPVQTADPKSFGSLAKDEIKKVVDRSEPEVQRCYLEARELWSQLEGSVVITFEIRPNGTVGHTAVAVYNSTITEAAVGCCVAHVAQTWMFPAPQGGKHVEVEYPFLLETDIFKVHFPATTNVGQPQPASGTEIHYSW